MAVWGLTVLTELTYLMAVFALDPASTIVVRVNGKAITAADVGFWAMLQNVPEDQRSQDEPVLIEQLIDRHLIRTFLAAKKIEPDANEVQHQIANAEELIRKNGEDPPKFLAKLGYTPARLKSEVGLPLAWYAYANRTIKPDQVKDYFEKHRQELDGTQLRASQIFLKLPKRPAETEGAETKKRFESDVAEKKQKLTEIRNDILAGKLKFAEAAKQNSEAPTAKDGGDLGLFGWQGKAHPAISQAAFAMKVDEISQPIVSQLGVHLIQVTERHPGDFSLEDVRRVIMKRLTEQLWTTTIAKERMTAKIERLK